MEELAGILLALLAAGVLLALVNYGPTGVRAFVRAKFVGRGQTLAGAER